MERGLPARAATGYAEVETCRTAHDRMGTKTVEAGCSLKLGSSVHTRGAGCQPRASTPGASGNQYPDCAQPAHDRQSPSAGCAGNSRLCRCSRRTATSVATGSRTGGGPLGPTPHRTQVWCWTWPSSTDHSRLRWTRPSSASDCAARFFSTPPVTLSVDSPVAALLYFWFSSCPAELFRERVLSPDRGPHCKEYLNGYIESRRQGP